MTALLIPTPASGYPDQTFKVSLAGTTYTVRWLWNGRVGLWSFSMSDGDGPIVSGVRVVQNVDLLATIAGARRPPGPIIVLDPSGNQLEPGLRDLGVRVKVVYLVPEEES